MQKLLFRGFARTLAAFGIGGISQSVAGDIVAKCGDPTLTDAEFTELVEHAKTQGYELVAAR